VVGLYSYAVYLWQIHHRTVKPHLFTWIIWGTMSSIGFAAQVVEKAGPGAWNLCLSAMINFVIAFLAFFHGEKNITRSDWIAFVAALSAIPVWIATDNPLWAVVIISVIDALAFYPTIRKSWMRPGEEGAAFFLIGTVQFILSILAMERMTITTVLYPGTIIVMNMLVVTLLLQRRRALA